MTTPSPTQAVADAAQAVEATFNEWDATGNEEWARVVLHRLAALLHARRAAQAAGFVECWLSQEMFEAYDKAMKFGGCNPGDVDDFFDVFRRDLGPLLKDEGEG